MDKYLKEAIDTYESNIDSGSPFYMDAAVLMDIEEYYDKNGKQYEAEHLMRFAEKLHPDNEDVQIVKAYRYKSAGKWNQAMDVITKIPNQSNRDVQLFYAEYDIACAQLTQAEERVQDNIPANAQDEAYEWYLDLSEIFLDYGYFKRSLKYLNKLPQNFKLKQRADELRADAYYQLGKYESSTNAYNELIDADPYDAISWTQLADIQQKDGKLSDCIVSCDYALAIDPHNQQAMSLKVFATFGLGKYKEGVKLYEQFKTHIPNEYSVRMYAGEQMLTHKEYAKARKPLQDALRLCPLDNADRPRIVNDLTYVLTLLDEVNLAEEVMMTLCTIGTEIIDIYFQLATIFFECNLTDQACRKLSQIIDTGKADTRDYVKLMQMLFQNQCFESVSELWIKIAKIEPQIEFYPLLAYPVYAMYRLKNAELYVQCLQKALINCPEKLVQIMGPLYNTTNAYHILEEGIKDAAKWKQA